MTLEEIEGLEERIRFHRQLNKSLADAMPVTIAELEDLIEVWYIYRDLYL